MTTTSRDTEHDPDCPCADCDRPMRRAMRLVGGGLLLALGGAWWLGGWRAVAYALACVGGLALVLIGSTGIAVGAQRRRGPQI